MRKKGYKIAHRNVPDKIDLHKSYKTYKDWCKTKIGEVNIESICQLLYKWSLSEKSLDFLQFYKETGIARGTFQDWKDKYPTLKDTYEHVKDIIAERRQRFAIFKKYGTEPTTLFKTMRLYHHEWKQVYEEDQAHKKDQDAIAELMNFFKNKEVVLPELDDSQRKNTPSSSDL